MARVKNIRPDSNAKVVPGSLQTADDAVDHRLADLSTRLPAELSDELVSLGDIWRIFSSYKWIIFALVLIGTGLAFASFKAAVPHYRADVTAVAVAEQETGNVLPQGLGNLDGLAALAGIDLERGSKEQTAIATLASRRLTMAFIEDRELLPVLFADRWDDEKQEWDATDPDDIPTLWDAWEYFDEKVRTVRNDNKTGLVTLSVDWRDPDEAAQWANELMARANTLLRAQATDESRKAIDYLQKQLRQTSVVELQEVVNHLIESEMKKVILANVNEDYAFRVVDPAIAPREPFTPLLLARLVFGFVVGLMSGLFLALLLHRLHSQEVSG